MMAPASYPTRETASGKISAHASIPLSVNCEGRSFPHSPLVADSPRIRSRAAAKPEGGHE